MRRALVIEVDWWEVPDRGDERGNRSEPKERERERESERAIYTHGAVSRREHLSISLLFLSLSQFLFTNTNK